MSTVYTANKKRMKAMNNVKKMQKSRKRLVIGVRVPTAKEILENPKRADFIGGGWIDSADPNTVNLYWHKRQGHFTIYSLLHVLEHETLHAVLVYIVDLEASMKLDNIHRSSCVRLTDDKLVFCNEIRMNKWLFPPYVEEPTEDLLD